jgi:hypothetical protein
MESFYTQAGVAWPGSIAYRRPAIVKESIHPNGLVCAQSSEVDQVRATVAIDIQADPEDGFFFLLCTCAYLVKVLHSYHEVPQLPQSLSG